MTATETAAKTTSETFGNAFRTSLSMALEECFTTVHGYMLDKGDSFFETLSGISAEEASVPVSSQGATLAAQVNHTRFYIDGLLDVVRTGEYKKLDWESSWQVGAVDDAAWQDLIDRLRTTYDEIASLAQRFDQWDEQSIGGAFGLVGHSMYHLGEVRAGISVIRDRMNESS